MSISKSLSCPKCDQSNSPKVWDEWTKKQVGIDDGEPYTSINDDVEDIKEGGTFYKCPVCNAEVLGVRLLIHNDLMDEGDVEDNYYEQFND